MFLDESDGEDIFEDNAIKKAKRKVVPLFSNLAEESEDEKKELLKIDNDDFIYAGASDKKGHSVVMQCRVKPWIPREVQIIVESGKLPYKTSSDFIRDAIYWRLKHWMVKFKNKNGLNLLKAKSLSEILAQESEITASFEEDLVILKGLISSNIGKPYKLKNISQKLTKYIESIEDEQERKIYKEAIQIVIESFGNEMRDYFK